MDQQTELLNQLKDINLPENSGWPIAPGWFLLAVLLLALLAYALRQWRAQRSKPSTRVDWQSPALAELQDIERRFQCGDNGNALADCSRLVRQVTLARANRAEVASLTGQAWMAKLDELSGTDFFSTSHGKLLATAPYQQDAAVEQHQMQEIFAAVQQLIQKHDDPVQQERV